jgi:glycine cleavage system regulatory protein
LNQLLQFFSNESITIQEMKSTYYVYDKSESEMISKLLE